MFLTTSYLKEENFLRLPEPLCNQWNISENINLYARMDNGRLILSKKEHIHAAKFEVTSEHGIILTDYFVKALGLKPGVCITLTLVNDTVILSRGFLSFFIHNDENKMTRNKYLKEYENYFDKKELKNYVY